MNPATATEDKVRKDVWVQFYGLVCYVKMFGLWPQIMRTSWLFFSCKVTSCKLFSVRLIWHQGTEWTGKRQDQNKVVRVGKHRNLKGLFGNSWKWWKGSICKAFYGIMDYFQYNIVPLKTNLFFRMTDHRGNSMLLELDKEPNINS